MSGPTYPPAVTSKPFDVWQTIISQFANSPILTQLIENLDAYLDKSADFDMFYSNIWDIDTAVGEGLDIWGRILGVKRILKVPSVTYFGFDESLPGIDGFGSGTFYFGAPVTQNYALSDDSYRTLLLAKAATNITDGSIPSINQVLLSLFPSRGNCYVKEVLPPNFQYFGFDEAINMAGFNQGEFYSGKTITAMSIIYRFEFALSSVELAIVEQSGALPKPVGVTSYVVSA